MRFVKPLDKQQLHNIFKSYEHVITVEDGCKIGGFGSAVLEFANEMEYQKPLKIFGIEDVFIEHGTVSELHEQAGIDRVTIKKYINTLLYA